MQSFRRSAAAPAIRCLLVRRSTTSSSQFVRRLTQNSGQGGSYASTGHTHGNMGAKGSDVPWMIGAVAFTVPASFYLLSGSSKPAHHSPGDHGHGDAKHTASTGAKNSPAEEGASSNEPKATKKQVSSNSESRETGDATSGAGGKAHEVAVKAGEKASELHDKAKKEVEASASKPTEAAAAVKEKASETLKETTGELKKKADNNTGGKNSKEDGRKDDETKVEKAKKEVEVKGDEKEETSGGENDKSAEKQEKPKETANKESVKKDETKSQTFERLNRENFSKNPSDFDSPAAGMKDPTNTNMQSGKQEGISNQDTWHAVLHSERGQAISKKAEGVHETAKLKGTVSPFRPARYDPTTK